MVATSLLTNDPSIALDDDQEVFGPNTPWSKRLMPSGDTVYVVTTPGNYRFVGNLTVYL